MFCNGSSIRLCLGPAGVGIWLALGFVILSFQRVHAQSAADTTLPDLAPREVEILGDLEIVFPSLRRQPLTGFNPPPRIFQVPRGRRPYTGAYKQERAEIPGTSLIRPPVPPAVISVGRNPQQGEVLVGLGSYLSREIRLVAAHDLSQSTRLAVDLGHDGYDSFKPFDDRARDEVEAPFRSFRGSVGIEQNLGASTLAADLSGFARGYELYGLQPDTLIDERPERDGQGFLLSGAYQGGRTTATPFTIEAAIGKSRFETGFDSVQIESSQSSFDLSGETEVRISERAVSLNAELARRGVESTGVAPDPTSSSATGYNLGGDVLLEIGTRSTIRLGARVLGYSTSDGHVPDTMETSKFLLAPVLAYRNRLAPGLELYLQNDPIARQTSQEEIFDVNPFVVDGPLLLPELSVLNSEVGVVFYAGPVRASARGGYAIYNTQLVFDPDSSAAPGHSGPLFRAGYEEAEVLHFGGDLGVAIPGSFSLALTADWRDASLDDEQDVPYLPSFGAGLLGTYSFARDRAVLQFDGKYVGSRKTSRRGGEELKGYMDLSALASYYVTPRIGVYIRANSITGDRFERWAGYPAADWIVMGGVRLSW